MCLILAIATYISCCRRYSVFSFRGLHDFSTFTRDSYTNNIESLPEPYLKLQLVKSEFEKQTLFILCV